MRTSCIAALGGVWLSACLAPDREDAAEGIVGGEACRADVSASVVMVGGHGGTNEVWGSAVLVAPDVLVTARHVVTRATPPRRQQCARDGTALPDAVPWELRPATPIYVYDRDGEPAIARVVEAVLADDPYNCDADLAVLILDRPLAGHAPRALRSSPVRTGEHVVVAGFGDTADDAVRRRCRQRAAEVISDSTRLVPQGNGLAEIVTTPANCFGDSGGAVLDEAGRLAATVVRLQERPGGGCGTPGIHADLSFRTEFVEGAIDRAAQLPRRPLPLPGRDREGRSVPYTEAAAWSCRFGCLAWEHAEPVEPVRPWALPSLPGVPPNVRSVQRYRDLRDGRDMGLVVAEPMGACLLTPDFEAAWMELGGPAGCLGWPTQATMSPEDAEVWRAEFERGSLILGADGLVQLASGCAR